MVVMSIAGTSIWRRAITPSVTSSGTPRSIEGDVGAGAAHVEGDESAAVAVRVAFREMRASPAAPRAGTLQRMHCKSARDRGH